MLTSPLNLGGITPENIGMNDVQTKAWNQKMNKKYQLLIMQLIPYMLYWKQKIHPTSREQKQMFKISI